MARDIVATEETDYLIVNTDGSLIYGTAQAGTNISTGQGVCQISTDGDAFYDLVAAKSVPWVVGMDVGATPVSFAGSIYLPIQAHGAASDLTPDVAKDLFKLIKN